MESGALLYRQHRDSPWSGYIDDIGDGGDGDYVTEYYGDFNENEGSLI